MCLGSCLPEIQVIFSPPSEQFRFYISTEKEQSPGSGLPPRWFLERKSSPAAWASAALPSANWHIVRHCEALHGKSSSARFESWDLVCSLTLFAQACSLFMCFKLHSLDQLSALAPAQVRSVIRLENQPSQKTLKSELNLFSSQIRKAIAQNFQCHSAKLMRREKKTAGMGQWKSRTVYWQLSHWC